MENNKINDEEIDIEEIIKAFKSIVPYTKDFTKSNFTITKMTFGLSCDSYKISNNLNDKIFLLKKFKSTHVHETLSVDRQKEMKIFAHLSNEGIAPKMIGISEDNTYRVEEFINCRIMKSFEINYPDNRKKLSILLGIINSLNLDDIINDKQNLNFVTNILNNEKLLDTYNKSLDQNLLENNFPIKYKADIVKMKYLTDESEINFIKKLLLESNLKMVNGHNDIWVGNILIEKNSDKLFIIDYEVMNKNFKGYDLGKLILETMYERDIDKPEYNLNINYFPSDKEIKEFCQYYLFGFNLYKYNNNNNNSNIDKDKIMEYSLDELIKILFSSVEEFEIELKELEFNTILGMLFSGFYSTILGIMIGPNVDYGMCFTKFAIDGFNIYMKYKKILMENFK